MALLAGYNQAEAVASLRAALTFDPHCAMCYWGLAYARSEAWGGRATLSCCDGGGSVH